MERDDENTMVKFIIPENCYNAGKINKFWKSHNPEEKETLLLIYCCKDDKKKR